MKVKRPVWNNESGFTLLEAIMTMVIFCLILSVMPLMYLSYSAVEQTLSTEKDYEWNLFLIQFRNELYSADAWRVGSNQRIFLEKNGMPISYERYGRVIRRKVRDTGHEIVLQNVGRLTFRRESSKLYMMVEFSDGTTEEAAFYLPFGEENA